MNVYVRTHALYLLPIFLIPSLSIFGHAIAPNQAIFKGQDLGIIISYALLAIGVVAWLFYDANQPRWSLMHGGFLAFLLVTWLSQTTSTHLDQSLFNLTALIVPVALLLIVFKRPDPSCLQLAFLYLLYSLVLISLASLVLGELGLMPNGFDSADSGGTRIAFMSDLFGIDNRWGGPFGSVNYAAPIGGLLFVSGLTLRSFHRIIVISSGLVILFLSQGRTSAVAVFAALVILVIYSPWVQRMRYRRVFQLSLITATTFSLISYIKLFDSTLNGRTLIWSDFFGLFHENTLWGIGSSGVNKFVEDRTGIPGLITHNHAHNVLLDIAVRYGILLGFLSLVVLILVLISTWQKRTQEHGSSLAIAAYIVIAGVAETIFSWQYWSVYLVVLLFLCISQKFEATFDKEHPKFGVYRVSNNR